MVAKDRGTARSQRYGFTAHPHRVSTRRRCVAILKNRSVVMSVCGNRWGTVVNVVRLVRKICHKWVNICCIEAARLKDRSVLIFLACTRRRERWQKKHTHSSVVLSPICRGEGAFSRARSRLVSSACVQGVQCHFCGQFLRF